MIKKKLIFIFVLPLLFTAVAYFLYLEVEPAYGYGFIIGGVAGFLNLLAISLTVGLGSKIGRGKGLVLISYYLRLILLAILVFFLVRKGVGEIVGFLLGFSFLKLSLLGLGLSGRGGE
ncbi:ATP synthase subunit I [Carboxydothermus pertinax]|uniref:ATP synthase subunit I n=1 Tax=Carboxydothermus pertinax TaxID=870242 RepID=A0A1L8CTG7_9THEO|nr:ATP synthase subunit I [Carboxydothermus pertinax]GAV22203.1 hypothetical protein cpu_07130 [Carboxydothermus pertinax]